MQRMKFSQPAAPYPSGRIRADFIICPDSAEVKIFLTQINTRRIFRKSPVSPIDFPPSGVV